MEFGKKIALLLLQKTLKFIAPTVNKCPFCGADLRNDQPHKRGCPADLT